MNLLIYGSNGWIGNQVINYLDTTNINYIKGSSRVDNINDIEKEIELHKPTHILSLIGRTHGKINDKIYTTIDYLEEPGKLDENVRDNLFSPLILAILCKKNNIHFTYLGTGCIFEYDKDHPFGEEINGFMEESLPNFKGSSYSIVKGYTDRLMHLYDNVLNLRIRMPINAENNARNFITKITNYEKICSIPNSMTVLPELIPLAIDMLKNNIVGTVNLTNPGLISHNEILELYKEIVDPTFTWNNFTIQEQNEILSSARSNNYLDTTKLESLYPNVKNIKDSIKECLLKYKPSEKIKQNNDINIKGTNILITGGCGFIASHFINYIFKKYDKINIINIDAMYYCASETNIDIEIRNSPRYKLIKGNICSRDLLNHVFNTYNINYIIHFAAQSHVQNSFDDSLQYTQDNVLGTHTLLECCRIYNKIKKFIHVSTDEVYGESLLNNYEKQKNELSTLCPTNPYAGTKAAAELIAQTYAHSFKMPIIITRGNNVYGLHQYPEKLIPKFIKLLKENKKVTIQGKGDTVRAFLHVNDTVKAFDIILNKGHVGEIYNIGCDEGMEYSVLDVAKYLIKFIKNTDNYDEWIEYIEDRPFNDARYYISNEKLKKLGWSIDITFLEGLKKLVNGTN
jgi:dTDP-glucose 4,6-dehydratase